MKNGLRFFFSFLVAAVITGVIAGADYGISLLEEKHYEETPTLVQVETEQIDVDNYREEGEFHGYIGEKYFYVETVIASSDVLEIPATLYDKPIFFTEDAFRHNSIYAYSEEEIKINKITVAPSNNDYVVENDALYSKDKKKLIYYFGKAPTFDFPEELEEIRSYAFADNDLKKITFSPCLDTIKRNAFFFSKIDELILPDTALNIESEAFDHCYIKHLVLPSKLEYIANGAFEDSDSSLEQLDINCSSAILSDSSMSNSGLFNASLFTGYDIFISQGEKLVINASDIMYPCNFTKILLYYKEVEINMPSKPKNYKANKDYLFIKRNVKCTFEGNTVKMLNKKTGNETIVTLNFKE